MLSYPVIEQGSSLNKASKALILLHGRGGTAQDILQLASEFCDHRFYIAAPQAPNHTWYPYSFLEEKSLNEPYLSSSIEAVKRLIDQITQYMDKAHIYLMGFSQGACLVLEASSRYAAKYGGVVAFTGGLIGKTLNQTIYSGHFEGTKVFIGNSDKDPHVPLIRSKQSKTIMEKMGAEVILKVYKGMGHTINEDEVRQVKELIIAN